MAAWIKVGASIHNKPEVLGIAKECGLGVDTVVGKLIRMWAWFDEMSANGHVSYGTNVWLDSYVGHEGFAQACASVGWLRISSDGLTMPNFDRHNGESSKKRLTDAARKRKSRSNQVPASDKRPQNVREMSHEKCDQIREDKIREEVTTLPADKPPKPRKPHWSEPAGSRLAKLTGCPQSGPWSFLSKLAREQTESAVLDALARFPWDRALNWKHATGWITEAAKSIHSTAPAPDDYEDRLD